MDINYRWSHLLKLATLCVIPWKLGLPFCLNCEFIYLILDGSDEKPAPVFLKNNNLFSIKKKIRKEENHLKWCYNFLPPFSVVHHWSMVHHWSKKKDAPSCCENCFLNERTLKGKNLLPGSPYKKRGKYFHHVRVISLEGYLPYLP